MSQPRASFPIYFNTGVALAGAPPRASVITDLNVGDQLVSAPRASLQTDMEILGRYKQIILADGPVAFWPLDEIVGDAIVVDITGHGHNGTFNGTITRQQASLVPSYVIGYSMAFANNATSFISVPDHSALNSAQFSLEFSQAGIAGAGTWVDLDHGQRYNFVITGAKVRIGGNGTTYVYSETDSGPNGAGQGARVHYILTFNGTTLRLYRDGVEYLGGGMPGATVVTPSLLQAGAPFRFGALGGNSSGQRLDAMSYWDRALTPAEVTKHFNALMGTYVQVHDYSGAFDDLAIGTPVLPSGPVEYARFASDATITTDAATRQLASSRAATDVSTSTDSADGVVTPP